jgi:type I restriction enzyme S subunit
MVGKYRAYPEYKDSGVDLLGDIPACWSLSRHKYIARFQKGKNPEVLLDTPNENSIKYLSMDYLRGNSDASFADIERSSYVSKKGQVLIIWDGSNAGEFVKGQEGIVSSTMAASELLSNIDHGFYWYMCVCIEPEMRKHANGMGIPHVNGNELKDSIILLPSKEEQEKIADFLDHETAKIDTLIEKQQQLIKLLKEKRQAVISHAVTKGLNPNAPMRDSSIEWLGEVPAHWVSSAFKHYARVIDCKHITAEFFDEGIPLASISEVKEKYVNLETAKLTTEKYYLDLISGGRKPELGDIIYSRNATVGEAALVAENMPKFAMGQDVCLIRMGENVYSEYILYVLKSGVISNQLDLAMVGSTFKRINVDDIRNFAIALPSYNEQAEIAVELSRILDKYDILITKAEATIELLSERRTALISAAVTGKIDVRNWQVPTSPSTAKNN